MKRRKIRFCNVFVIRVNKYNDQEQIYYVTGSEGRKRKYPVDEDQIRKEVLEGDKSFHSEEGVGPVMIRRGNPVVYTLDDKFVKEIKM